MPLTQQHLMRLLQAVYNLELSNPEWLSMLARHAPHTANSRLVSTQCTWYEEEEATGQVRIFEGSYHRAPAGADVFAKYVLKSLYCAGEDVIEKSREHLALSPNIYTFLSTPIGRIYPGLYADIRVDGFPSVRDFSAVIAGTGSASLMLGGLSQTRVDLSTRIRSFWAAAAPHVLAAFKVRRALEGGHSLRVLSVYGRTEEYVDSEVKEDLTLREKLRRTVHLHLKFQDSRPIKSSVPSDLFDALMDGSFALLDVYESGQEHYVVAVEVPSPHHTPYIGLAELERRVALAVAMSGDKYYAIGQDLPGKRTETTVTSTMNSVMSKLRIRSRTMLTVLASPCNEAVVLNVGARIVVAHSPASVVSLENLTPVEREVADALLSFVSIEEMVEQGLASRSGVKKRIARVYRKMGTGCKAEFFCKCKGV